MVPRTGKSQGLGVGRVEIRTCIAGRSAQQRHVHLDGVGHFHRSLHRPITADFSLRFDCAHNSNASHVHWSLHVLPTHRAISP